MKNKNNIESTPRNGVIEKEIEEIHNEFLFNNIEKSVEEDWDTEKEEMEFGLFCFQKGSLSKEKDILKLIDELIERSKGWYGHIPKGYIAKQLEELKQKVK